MIITNGVLKKNGWANRIVHIQKIGQRAMINITFEPTHIGRTDANKSIKRSIDIPGHGDRLIGHCERVQREYFDSGLHKLDTHPTEKHKLMRDRRSND